MTTALKGELLIIDCLCFTYKMQLFMPESQQDSLEAHCTIKSDLGDFLSTCLHLLVFTVALH